ncbi:MAG: methyltransferase domain-containing protein [Spirochaetes bacterium]|nr:methyltransferase domain-containing protein [Spirochaetota bacterium]
MDKARVLFCTAAGGGYGMGHLRRCLALCEEGAGRFQPSLCLLRGSISLLTGIDLAGARPVRRPADAGSVDVVVTDLRRSRPHEMRRLSRLAPVVALDDAGRGSESAAVCVYSLPLARPLSGNLYGPEYLVFSPRILSLEPVPFERKKGVLVSFGGSDPEGCTRIVTVILNGMGIRPVVVKGPFSSPDVEDLDVETVGTDTNLLKLINESRVLITSFGMTMYEACYLGTPVLLFNRSAYHQMLSKKADATSIGFVGGPDEIRSRLEAVLGDERALVRTLENNRLKADGLGASRVVSIILGAARGVRKDCLFSHRRYAAVRRENDYTLHRCRRCGDLFLFEIRDKGRIYDDKDYFLSDYERQYGRSYIEDRDNIVSIGAERIGIIEEIAVKKGRILDVGCALGFFLDLARARGWETVGVEISKFASEWARKNLSLDVRTGSFLETDLPSASFDAVSFLFVAEHAPDTEAVVRKAYAILKKGGILCVALPNRGGVSYRTAKRTYIADHPRDHYIDTTVRNLGRFLRGYGFRKKRARVTGIHPTRFYRAVGIEHGIPRLDRIYTAAAKIFSLGDTFEFYAVKE